MSAPQDPFDTTGAPGGANVVRFPPRTVQFSLDDISGEIEAARAEYDAEQEEAAAKLASQAIELVGGTDRSSTFDYAFAVLARAMQMVEETELVAKATHMLGPPRGFHDPGEAA